MKIIGFKNAKVLINKKAIYYFEMSASWSIAFENMKVMIEREKEQDINNKHTF